MPGVGCFVGHKSSQEPDSQNDQSRLFLWMGCKAEKILKRFLIAHQPWRKISGEQSAISNVYLNNTF
jgi:hypothetical protein